MKAVVSAPLHLEGDLTVQFAAEHKPLLLATLETTTVDEALEVDLSGVSEMDTAGLQLLLMLKREARQLGRTLHLLAPSRAVLEVLALARLNGELEPLIDQTLVEKRGA